MFVYETAFLDLEIFRLITILEASPALADFEGSETDENKVAFLRGLEFPEVSRIVMSFAAIIRSAIDANPRAYAGSSGSDDLALDREVGTLVTLDPDESDTEVREPLRFREACNKVLHADHVDPETTGTGALTGHLSLYGRHYKKEWRAELDLKQYALSALTLSP